MSEERATAALDHAGIHNTIVRHGPVVESTDVVYGLGTVQRVVRS